MEVYIYNLFSILIYALVLRFMPLSQKKAMQLLGGIVVIQFSLFAILRHESVGRDLINYIEYFKYVSNIGIGESAWDGTFEHGYVLYNQIISIFSKDYRMMIAVADLFIYLSFVLLILKQSKTPWMSLFIFVAMGFYSAIFNLQRQYMAIAILTYSINFALKRRLLKFLLCIFLAYLFHTTAIVFVVIYPLVKYRSKIITIFIAFVSVVILVPLFGGKIISLLMTFFKYNKYQWLVSESDSGYGMLILLAIIVFGALYLYRKKEYNIRVNLFLNILIVGLFLQILAIYFSLFSRVVLYFWVYMILLLPNIIECIEHKEIKRVMRFVVCSLTLVYFIIYVLTDTGGNGIIPYKFMWEM